MSALLALDPRPDETPAPWTGWTGVRVGANHTHADRTEEKS